MNIKKTLAFFLILVAVIRVSNARYSGTVLISGEKWTAEKANTWCGSNGYPVNPFCCELCK